jgi:hypothetical protein
MCGAEVQRFDLERMFVLPQEIPSDVVLVLRIQMQDRLEKPLASREPRSDQREEEPGMMDISGPSRNTR